MASLDNPNLSSEEDLELEKMLRHAAMLQAQMKSSSSIGADGGSSAQDEGLSSLAYSDDAGTEQDADHMLFEAERLASKMRASRDYAIAASVGESSLDDMIKKAELLAQQIKEAASLFASPSPTNLATEPIENTPALIRRSEDLLSKMHHRESSQSGRANDVTTPELMRRTEQVLGRMKASGAVNYAMRLHESSVNDVLSRSDQLLAQARSASTEAQLHHSSQMTPPYQQQDPGHTEELRRLMDEALSKWTASGEDACRIKEALEHIIPTLGSPSRINSMAQPPDLRSTSNTPSTVSVPQPETDEMSSLGSMSPRTPPKALPQSLLNADNIYHGVPPPPLDRPPRPSQNIDASIELARNMQISLHESEASSQASQIREGHDALAANWNIPIVDRTVPTSNCQAFEAPRDLEVEAGAERTNLVAGASSDEVEGSEPRQLYSPPEMADETTKASNGSNDQDIQAKLPPTPPPRTRAPPVSSEEAQFNAIMAAIDSAPASGVKWDKVSSATQDDEDYVPLADYSRKSPVKRSIVSEFLEMPTVNRFGRYRKRQKSRAVKRFVVLIVIAATAVFARSWLRRAASHNEATAPERVEDAQLEVTSPERVEDAHVEAMTPERVEDAHVDASVLNRHIEDTHAEEAQPVMDEKTHREVALGSERGLQIYYSRQVGIGSKLRMQVSQTAKKVRKVLLHFVISLTPPWERFCPHDSREACRDTTLLMNSIQPPFALPRY